MPDIESAQAFDRRTGRGVITVPDLARDVVAAIAPHELELLPDVTRAWLAGRLNGRRQGRWLGGSIGIGLDPQLVTLLIYPLLTGALAPILERGTSRWGRLIGWRKRTRRHSDIPPLSQAQIRQVQEACYRSALRSGLPKTTAGLLADAVSGVLLRDTDSAGPQ